MTHCIPVAFKAQFPHIDLDLLNTLAGYAPFACVAGGFLRDQFFGKAPKDLDLFVSPQFEPDFYGLEKSGVFLIPPSPVTGSEYIGAESRGITNVYDVSCRGDVGGFPIQVIVMDAYCLEEVFLTFDYGFCQIGLEMGGRTDRGVCVTPEFLRDAAMNTATMTRKQPYHSVEHIEARRTRLQGRYPGRTFVDPFNPIGMSELEGVLS